ncbi:MAG TPA: A/G-specific adenine glycosylase [Thermoanaerobaculia bacterium]|nr:A/G-specific adenine glycosylase [Thermoanaerobaculia bacterium]
MRATWVARELEKAFVASARSLPWRESYEPYAVWLSEVMLQQTRMEVVLGYFRRFLDRFPDVAALAGASEEEVLAAWSGLGYYRRARALHRAAGEVMERFGGKLPAEVEMLRTLPGIGRYTAGAIASIAHDRREPIVDGNVARVIARLEALPFEGGSPELMSRAWIVARKLVESCRSPQIFNQAIMEHGALICRPRNPRCDLCPVSDACRGYASGNPQQYPVLRRRRAVTRLQIPLYLVVDRRGRILVRREEGPLMTAMMHLPHGNRRLLSEAEPGRFSRLGALGRFRHTVTHRRVEFELWGARLIRPHHLPAGHLWIDAEALAASAHPSYVRKALLLAERAIGGA